MKTWCRRGPALYFVCRNVRGGPPVSPCTTITMMALMVLFVFAMSVCKSEAQIVDPAAQRATAKTRAKTRDETRDETPQIPERSSVSTVLPHADVTQITEPDRNPLFQPATESTGEPTTKPVNAVQDTVLGGVELGNFVQPERLESSIKTVALLSIVSLAPAILLMTTSFVRISVVLGLLRQAIGTQMLPSNQVVTSLAMFLTLLVMAPVWKQVYESAVVPYTNQESPMTAKQAWEIGVMPVREFMIRQIELAENSDEVLMFYDYLPDQQNPPESYDDVPLQVLLPAFMLSELKVAFLIGFQIYLPFLIVDLVVASVTVSMGMMMLPPAMVSLPLKLLLFVMVDGWQLVVGMLLQSFGGYG